MSFNATNTLAPLARRVSMFSTYDRDGVSLVYPEGWRADEESDEDARLQLTLSSPNTAFWTLILYAETLELRSVADQALEALRQEYPDLEAETAEEVLHGAVTVGHDVNFICLDLTSTTHLRAFHRGATTCLVMCQAEDRELDTVEPVFAAITASLLGALPRQPMAD
ncbi:MAG: hypothetical protein AAF805_01685 [Planctomycetota bacterium]